LKSSKITPFLIEAFFPFFTTFALFFLDVFFAVDVMVDGGFFLADDFEERPESNVFLKLSCDTTKPFLDLICLILPSGEP